MPEATLLPLFPLELVLLPGATAPLHIFEPRYRRMVGAAAKDSSEFGIILVQDGKVEPVGCTAIVQRVTKRYDDGRFDVDTVGVRRFEAIEFDQSEECLRASVEYFDDMPDSPVSEEERSDLVRLARQAAVLVGMSDTGLDSLEQAAHPSFEAGAALPFELALKQKLLTERSERARIQHLREYLEAWMAQREAQQRARRLVGQNGKPR